MSDPAGIPAGLIWAIGCSLIALFLALTIYRREKKL